MNAMPALRASRTAVLALNGQVLRLATGVFRCSKSRCANDSGTLHLSMAGRVVHHRVMLCRAVVPDGDAAGLPAPADLVLGDRGLADQELQQTG
ncbi:hypothetical protein SDC9_177821 [bioreactor metagenome]|uniref:Uncharacterized protein n=1 Tax=bioreactor metagenome TaxID=1076179 RepID=A0A645GVI6_9ZZZZ